MSQHMSFPEEGLGALGASGQLGRVLLVGFVALFILERDGDVGHVGGVEGNEVDLRQQICTLHVMRTEVHAWYIRERRCRDMETGCDYADSPCSNTAFWRSDMAAELD